jgi:hypothetical protein
MLTMVMLKSTKICQSNGGNRAKIVEHLDNPVGLEIVVSSRNRC